MSNLADALSGTGVVILLFNGLTYDLIGGQTAHSKSLTFEPIDITNKSEKDVRCFMEGEGRKTADITAEILYSSDAAYQSMRDKYDNKDLADIRVRYADDDSRVDDFKVMITAISEPVEQNTAVTSSITFSSSSDFEINKNAS